MAECACGAKFRDGDDWRQYCGRCFVVKEALHGLYDLTHDLVRRGQGQDWVDRQHLGCAPDAPFFTARAKERIMALIEFVQDLPVHDEATDE